MNSLIAKYLAYTFIFVFLSTGFVSGCVPKKNTTSPRSPDLTEVKIMSLAKEIEESLRVLAKLEASSGKLGEIASYSVPSSGPLATPVTLNWSGPVEPAIKLIAELCGYTFRSSGRAPINPPVITVSESNSPAFEVLESIGWQAGEVVTVVVNEQDSIISVVYRED